jgi:hypothetical protein
VSSPSVSSASPSSISDCHHLRCHRLCRHPRSGHQSPIVIRSAVLCIFDPWNSKKEITFVF